MADSDWLSSGLDLSPGGGESSTQTSPRPQTAASSAPPLSGRNGVTSDPLIPNEDSQSRGAALNPSTADLGIQPRSGDWDPASLGITFPTHDARSDNSFSKLRPLRGSSLSHSDHDQTGDDHGSPRETTPEEHLLAVQKLPPLAQPSESESLNGLAATVPKVVDDDVTEIKRVAQEGASWRGGGLRTRDQEVTFDPSRSSQSDPDGSRTASDAPDPSWVAELEAARLAAYPPHPRAKPLPPGKDFHVFFSYCWRDRPWVCEMVDVLEKQHGFKCCYHERDFKPGARIIENITYHIERSGKTIIVVSPAFLESEWCSYEAEVVMHLSVDQRRRLLIPVLLEVCDLPGALRPLTYIDATVSSFLDKIIAAISDDDLCLHDRPLPMGRTDFFFNPNFYSLDYLCDVTSKWTCCRGEVMDSPYVPEALTTRGLHMSLEEHGEAMSLLTKASSCGCAGLFDFTCTCVTFMAAIIPTSLVAALFIGMAAKINGKPSLAASICLPILEILAALALTVVPCLGCNFIRKRRLRKAMKEVNRIYFRHQLITGLVTNLDFCRRFVVQLKVHYFDHRHCQDYLENLLSPRPSPLNEDEQLIGADLSVGGGGQRSATELRSLEGRDQGSRPNGTQGNGMDTELLIPCGDNDVGDSPKDRALELLLSHSDVYMRKYLTRKLPVCACSRHARQVPCLCQYVEERIAVA